MKRLGLSQFLSTKKKRKREFLEDMERVVPWAALVQILEPHSPRSKTGRPREQNFGNDYSASARTNAILRIGNNYSHE